MGFHYVPQKYLEGFRDPKRTDPRIWQFDKKTGVSSHPAIRHVANERGYYSEQDEATLSREVDGPAGPVLDKLRARLPISTADRQSLVRFIATMLTRVPRLRSIREGLAPQALKESFDNYRELVRRQMHRGLMTEQEAAARLEDADRFEHQCAIGRPAFAAEQIKRPWPTPNTVDLVGRMAWRFVATKGPSLFVTSDDPGSFFHAFGLSHTKSELIFPISTEVALHASWQPNPWQGIRPVKQVVVREFNRRIALGAHRFVFSHERAGWIGEVTENKVEQLSCIEW